MEGQTQANKFIDANIDLYYVIKSHTMFNFYHQFQNLPIEPALIFRILNSENEQNLTIKLKLQRNILLCTHALIHGHKFIKNDRILNLIFSGL